MPSSKTTIQFINHASVRISYEDVSLLSDPWYFGDAFHKGWNLLVEQSTDEIMKIINSITHIWISHEHPDHFSISFFKTYEELIKNQGIEIQFNDEAGNGVPPIFDSNGQILNKAIRFYIR